MDGGTAEQDVQFCHQVSDMQTGTALYSGAVTALLMDLTTRKAVELPEFMAEPEQSNPR